MNINEKNLEKARELLNELHNLERALYVNSSYRSEVSVKFSTDSKHECPKTIEIPCPSVELRNTIVNSINKRISEIKAELENL